MSGKPLTFPEAKRWEDLFEEAIPHDPRPGVFAPILVEWPCPDQHGRPEPPLQLSSFCAVDGRPGYQCLQVKPKQEVIDWISDNMLRISDHLSFRVVIREGGEALVVVSHSCIIGSRWLALIDADSVPDGTV